MSLTEECTQKAASPPEKFSIKSEMHTIYGKPKRNPPTRGIINLLHGSKMHTTANQKEIPLQEVLLIYCMDLRYNPPPPENYPIVRIFSTKVLHKLQLQSRKVIPRTSNLGESYNGVCMSLAMQA